MKNSVESTMREISQLYKNFPWQDQEAYAWWLSQIYYIVRHSTPLLALSCGRALHNPTYHSRCIEHLSEERGHDRMLLNDLKFLGETLRPELPATHAVYATQYYKIEHVNTVAFLGYILFLEALAIYFGKEALGKVDSKSSTFLKLHAEEDVDHLEKAYKLIAGLPHEDQIEIEKNLFQTARAYRSMLEDISPSAIKRMAA